MNLPQEDKCLCLDDVANIMEAADKGENILCSSRWLIDLAKKITNTLNELKQLRSEVVSDNCHVNKKQKVDVIINPSWSGQLMYKHRGFSIARFEDLGNLPAESKEYALELAKDRAKVFIDDNFKENEIEFWDVKVRPLI